MISMDTNILLYAYCEESPFHAKASLFLSQLADRENVAVSEFILTEFYLHLRNPAVLKKPLSAQEAAAVVREYRRHPVWQILGFAQDTRGLHDSLWKQAGKANFPRRRIYDVRTALSLTSQGVTDFATCNEKDFIGLGFKRVWNPLVAN